MNQNEDPYCWPGTDCLRNKLGVRESDRLKVAEHRIVALRDAAIAVETLPGEYDLEHLKSFHRALFQDIYDWAGDLRTVQISKGPVPFCHPQYLDEQSSAALSALNSDQLLRGLNKDAFVAALAKHYGEVNACHPFREGNGRTQRAFFRQLAAAAGWRLDWSELSSDDNVSASSSSLVTGSSDELARIFAPIVSKI